jgi:aerobic carbon-monoxide dehydrogenase medium subunit
VKPSSFVHHAPRSVDEAVTVLAEVGHDGKVLAGGQSLIPILNMRLAAPAHLIDINRVSGLGEITVTPGAVRIGALVRHAQLERHEGARAALPLLRQALLNVAHPVIRNRGTTVGSIAHADPSGEMPAVLALLDGHVEVASARGARQIASADFFLGPLESSLAEDEMAVGASFQRLPAGSGTAFLETARRHGDYALAGVAAAVTAVDGAVSRVRLSFVSVTPTPDVLDLTEVFAGRSMRDVDWTEAAGPAREHVDPDADIHATVAYRRMLVGVLTAKALARAVAAATGDPIDTATDTGAAPPAGAARKA